MDCPICSTFLNEYDSEWLSDKEQLFQADCPKCGWRGNILYVSETTLWDYRTDSEVPSDPKELEAWRAENVQYYNTD